MWHQKQNLKRKSTELAWAKEDKTLSEQKIRQFYLRDFLYKPQGKHIHKSTAETWNLTKKIHKNITGKHRTKIAKTQWNRIDGYIV